MLKTLGKVLLAVIALAVGNKIIKKKYPDLTKKATGGAVKALNVVRDKVEKCSAEAKEAFAEGYSSSNTK